jgi:hypothetical protein
MITLGEVAIIGGGCYGSFYLGQLGRARAAGAVTWEQLLVVDRDVACAAARTIGAVPDAALVVESWPTFLGRWLADPARGDADRIVPSPLMPHLLADWVRDRAAARWPRHHVRMVPVEAPVGTPFDQLHPGDGNRYVSHADWLCPVHCIEPATCPKIRAPRSWEMSETVTSWAQRSRTEGPPRSVATFACRHVTFGVGMVSARAVIDAVHALDEPLSAGDAADLVLASVSSCHGALAVLRVEAS